MIVYAVDHGAYITMEESLRRQPQGKRNMYVNITNRCTCACTFCLRGLKTMDEGTSLWLKEEPARETVRQAIADAPWAFIQEVVFCGFGEPTMRLDDLLELLRDVRKTHPEAKTRLNTNGLSDLEYGRDTAPDFDGLLDTISISLNASNAERYLALTRSKFGLVSYDAMLDFAQHCQRYVPNVVLTVVDRVEGAEEIAACRRICEERGLALRVRAYEGS